MLIETITKGGSDNYLKFTPHFTIKGDVLNSIKFINS